MGMLTRCGASLEKSWSALVQGRSGIGPITLFDASRLETRIAGEVRDFVAEDFIERRELRRMDRFAQLAGASSDAHHPTSPAFGEHARAGLAVSSAKRMTRHMNGAAGAAEAIISVLSLTRGLLPPTLNLKKQNSRVHLDLVPGRARERRVEAVMNNSFSFGGTNATLVFRRAPQS